MDGDGQNSSANSRGHLQLAASYTRDAWLPPAPQAVARIEGILGHADGAIDRELLLSEIKRDIAVSSAVLHQFIKPTLDGTFGFEQLRATETERIKDAFSRGSLLKSKHSIESLTPWQVARIQESLVSVSTAESLSASFQVDSEVAYTCAMLRQLGLSLLAWNYPHVFRRALTIIRPGESLDLTLGKILGFTPTLITLTLMRGTGASPFILKTLGDHSASTSLSLEEEAQANKLSAICRISEAMARATSPNLYPSSSADWELSQKELENHLGKSGWRILESALDWYLDGYRSASATLSFPPQIITDLSAFAKKSIGESSLFDRNLHAKLCSSRVQRILSEFYIRISDPTAQTSAMNFLITQAAQRCGFLRGALCQRTSGIEFTPTFTFGSWPHTPPGKVPRTVAETIAITSNSRVAQQGIYHESSTGWVAAIVGETQRSALLYLEVSPDQPEPALKALGTVFKALLQAAGDGLKTY